MNSRYKILITDPDGSAIADLSDRCLSREYELIRNRSGYIKLTFDIDDLDAYFASINQTISEVFATNVNEIHIYRNEKQMCAGQINYLNVSIADNPVIEVYANGWLQLFDTALTSVSQSYSATDIGEIMWGLINTFQSQTDADFGVTEGSIEASRDADRTYEYKNIKDAIIQLSEVLNSPDFEITPSKVFNVYYPSQGRKNTEAVFTYPGNIIATGYSQDGSYMANQVIAEGVGTGADRLLSISNDVSSRPTHKLRQRRVSFPDVSIQETLDDHADEELRVRSRLLNLPKLVVAGDVDPVLGSYGLGDEVLVQATKHRALLAPILGWWRVESYKVSIDQNDFETVTIRLGDV